MKLDAPANANYAAVVTRLPQLKQLDGLDNLRAAPLLGFQALISKDHEPGELGVVFPAECQLSEEMCRENNLFRHAEKNADPEQTGYLEDNRRVRAIKLRGHRSDCLWMPLDSLAWTGAKLGELTEGDTFDKLGDHEVCRKYVIRTARPSSGQAKQVKKFERVDPRLFPEHTDTSSWFRESHLIGPDEPVVVTAKLHGTSARFTRTQVLRKLPLRDRIARRLGVKVETTEWDAVAGSRKVIKDPRNEAQAHFYGSDVWTTYLAGIEHLIPEGWIVYGEIVGWVDEATPIQADYTYSLPPGQSELYVYRIATVNVRGVVVDLSWPQVKQWCEANDVKHVPELWTGLHKDFVAEDWIDKRFADEGYDSLALGPNKKLVDEGVCVRAERLTPVILKAKSPIFLGHETKLLDKGEVSIEDEQAADEDAA